MDDDDDEIVGSDFIGLEDEEISVEALEQRLRTLQERKEELEKRKKKEELLAKIKQAQLEVSSLERFGAQSTNEIDSWNEEKLKQFFKSKGITVAQRSKKELKPLVNAILKSNLSDHNLKSRSEQERRTVSIGGTEHVFQKNSDLFDWSNDLTSLPCVEHFQADAFIMSSSEFYFDVNRLKALKNDEGYLLFKADSVHSIQIHRLRKRFCYVKCKVQRSLNDRAKFENVWSLLHEDGNIESAGCTCDRDYGCCSHVIALLLSLAAYSKTNQRSKSKLTCDKGTQIYLFPNNDLSPPDDQKILLDKENDLVRTRKKSFLNHSDDELESKAEIWIPPSQPEELDDILRKSNDSLQYSENDFHVNQPKHDPNDNKSNQKPKLGYKMNVQDQPTRHQYSDNIKIPQPNLKYPDQQNVQGQQATYIYPDNMRVQPQGPDIPNQEHGQQIQGKPLVYPFCNSTNPIMYVHNPVQMRAVQQPVQSPGPIRALQQPVQNPGPVTAVQNPVPVTAVRPVGINYPTHAFQHPYTTQQQVLPRPATRQYVLQPMNSDDQSSGSSKTDSSPNKINLEGIRPTNPRSTASQAELSAKPRAYGPLKIFDDEFDVGRDYDRVPRHQDGLQLNDKHISPRVNRDETSSAVVGRTRARSATPRRRGNSKTRAPFQHRDETKTNSPIRSDHSARVRVYSRAVLMKLSKSVYSKQKPYNYENIPDDIRIGDKVHFVQHVQGPGFDFTPGYVKDKRPTQEYRPVISAQGTGFDFTPGYVKDKRPTQEYKSFISAEEVMRKAMSAINMIKHGGEETMVLSVMSELPINEEDVLTRLVSLIVDTVVEDPSLTTICLKISRLLARVKLPKGDGNGAKITFSSVYLEKCQNEIEDVCHPSATESDKRRIEELSRFTGSIANIMLLKNTDIHSILLQLGTSNIECFCILLTEVWERMKKCKEGYIDQYKELIDSSMNLPDVPTTVKYKLFQLKSKH